MRFWSSIACISLACWLVQPAQARTGTDVPYGYDQVWSAVIRLVRVDLRFTIDESDKDLGFVLFQYKEGKRELPGSIELIRDKEKETSTPIQAVIQIPGMPAYVEQVMLDQLKRKMKADYGAPLPPPPKKKPESKPEGGKKSDSEKIDSESKGSTMRERDASGSKVRGDERRESGSDSPSR